MLERRAEQGLRTPALERRPVLYLDAVPAWNAFNQLHVARPWGFGAPLGLRTSDVEAWLSIHGFTDPVERAELYELIVAMDTAWLKRWAVKHADSESRDRRPEGQARRR